MQFPQPHDRTHAVARLAAAILAAAVPAACAGDIRTVPPDSTVTIAPPATPAGAPPSGAAVASVPALPPRAEPPARDADQRFLRRMLDHHEAIITIAHEAMMEPEGHGAHGSATDPSATDAALDAEKLEMLGLLQSLYGEQYSPRPARGPGESVSAAPARDEDHSAEGMAGGAESEQSEVAAAYRAGIAMIDEAEHHLRRPEVRALADRLRRTQTERLREVSVTPPSHTAITVP